MFQEYEEPFKDWTDEDLTDLVRRHIFLQKWVAPYKVHSILIEWGKGYGLSSNGRETLLDYLKTR